MSLSLPARASDLKGRPPAECTQDGCVCYPPLALDKISKGLTDLRKCQVALENDEKYITERFANFDQNHGIAWWQEPTTVAAGMTISFSLGAAVIFFLAPGR